MSKINFSFVAIMKNEVNVLPRLFDSLTEIMNRGCEFVILDTGSTDGSVEYAKSRGAIVHEVGSMFVERISNNTATDINLKFIHPEETNIVEADDMLFNFAAARNFVTSLAKNDFVFTLDCDEAYSMFDIDKIINLIEGGVEQFEYNFVYAHDQFGREAVKFIQSKAFDRRKARWTGRVHEVLEHYNGGANIQYLDESIIKLEHWQEQGKEHRGNYLTGLALECFLNRDNDRNSHYFARELMWTGRYRSAIREFERHVAMNKWNAERAQSLIFIGDCYGRLNDGQKQIEYYLKAFEVDPHRREALIKLAGVYKHNKNYQAAAVYAYGAMQIPFNGYYANDKAMYEHIPHEILYESQGWLGNIEEAQNNLLKCLEYQPLNPKFLHDTRFFFEYPSSMIDGWMTFNEQTFLYNIAKKYNGGKIAEIGSWKGRSSCALLTGNKDGEVYCIDTWQGSDDVRDDTNWMAKKEDVFEIFKENTKQFPNLRISRRRGSQAANAFPNGYFDIVFIDAGHTYEEVKEDIENWLPKVKKGGVLCGHDYIESWMGVIKAVDESFDEPHDVIDSIWVIYL